MNRKDSVSAWTQLHFRFYSRGWLIFLLSLGTAGLICILLQHITSSDVHVPLIFVLAVLVVSLLTDGYFYGLLAAVVSVFGVNFAFTYPYMKLDFSVTGYPLTFLTLFAVGFITSALTSRLKAQEQLRIESERERMRANLLRSVSHDLRTPLTSISGSVNAVLESGDQLAPEVKRDLLQSASQDAEWLCRMVENLLSVTRISDDTGGIVKRQELLEEVLSEAVQHFRKRHPNLPVSVTVPEEAILLPMDAMLIEQVMTNLMENAAEHGKGLTRIEVDTALTAGEVRISVRDDGCGIDEARMARLFDGSLPLSSGNRADGSKNMGIGLSVCRTIVEAHGGKIWAASSPETGTEFCFTLPMEEGTS